MKKTEQQQKVEEEKNKEKQVPVDYFLPSPNKEDSLPHCDYKMKQALDPNYNPPKYVPKDEEDTPSLADNLVAPPVKTLKEEDQGEDHKEKKNRGETNREEEDGKEDKIHADSGQEAEEEDYLDYSQTLFIRTVTRKTKLNQNSVIIYNSVIP